MREKGRNQVAEIVVGKLMSWSDNTLYSKEGGQKLQDEKY